MLLLQIFEDATMVPDPNAATAVYARQVEINQRHSSQYMDMQGYRFHYLQLRHNYVVSTSVCDLSFKMGKSAKLCCMHLIIVESTISSLAS